MFKRMEINRERLDEETLDDLRRLEREYEPQIIAITSYEDTRTDLTRIAAGFYRAGLDKGIEIAMNPDKYLE